MLPLINGKSFLSCVESDLLFLVFRIIMDVPLQLKELIFQMMIRIDLN